MTFKPTLMAKVSFFMYIPEEHKLNLTNLKLWEVEMFIFVHAAVDAAALLI